ncbi:hypothetical protein niasHT_011399 [Heterodera trifolii]|uniref:Uncharacterized protein n=1 Tax=Heterodera trifolii TaxID=157864 RepID=A0ABD2LID4_9BILA
MAANDRPKTDEERKDLAAPQQNKRNQSVSHLTSPIVPLYGLEKRTLPPAFCTTNILPPSSGGWDDGPDGEEGGRDGGEWK